MASLTIRQIDETVKEGLRKRAAEHGISMEEAARRALQSWVAREPERGLGTRIHTRFVALGGVELDSPPRTSTARPLPDIFSDE